ncbi:MAG: response regulator [Owenweeksia sp.]
MDKIKIVMADDEELFLNGLKALLEKNKNLSILFTANDGEELLKKLADADDEPDIALVDLRMKKKDGIVTTGQLKELYPNLKIIILSSHYRDNFVGYMLKLGVNAFLPKDINPNLLQEVIEQVQLRGLYFTDDQLKGLQDQLGKGSAIKAPPVSEGHELTGRETEILQLICEQYTNAEIAEKLFISIRTVEGHRNNLLLKTGAKNTAGLVLFAMAHKLIDWDAKLMEFGLHSR